MKLAPFKYEQKHKNPEIAVIHELISRKQAQSIINEASGRMRSTPFTVGAESQGYSKLRTSKVMYMNEKLIPKAMELSKNVELAMRFRLSHERFASENFQIMNYGLGGMISGHVDSHGAVFNENGHNQDHKSKNKKPKSFTSVKADLHSRQKDRGIFIPPLSSLL